MKADAEPGDEVFDALRPGLTRLAYRMLGSVSDAEDMVQDAWLRWRRCDRAQVRSPAAFLRTVVTRLCLNELESARRRRETYVGAWLPEPLVEPLTESPLEAAERRADQITLPLMLALERLSPLERAAFLLHDVFGVSFAEIGDALGREPAACRKLASRARAHLQTARPRFAVSPADGQRIAAAFFRASRAGDMAELEALLAADVFAQADGGGKVPATPAPILGRAQVLARHAALARGFAAAPSELLGYVRLDGLPGFVSVEQGVLQTTALMVDGAGSIAGIYVVRNPDKLGHLTRWSGLGSRSRS
ncbi:sigma-70 family RNA polymerase sigma factor [Pseudenhygromyxa sp. WMMC2535]|uniref:sigma-70 family RNA polymerase sigma factor n=1 Tax=Pseudenhygromyxa sp. WMMC2535 TaxID=2712867 RepID=UPI001551D165|nr:sigma-70 family RNA polymerase sigma factor [Pseudenhygromyxa sp. WMMC2535]NVB37213.1 sigma-70 family RNA polymerase sigma factor [Pseudenhygromyxa sp. WMMC2535]